MQDRFHGLRCAREDAGCAAPVATFLRPVGAKRDGGLYLCFLCFCGGMTLWWHDSVVTCLGGDLWFLPRCGVLRQHRRHHGVRPEPFSPKVLTQRAT